MYGAQIKENKLTRLDLTIYNFELGLSPSADYKSLQKFFLLGGFRFRFRGACLIRESSHCDEWAWSNADCSRHPKIFGQLRQARALKAQQPVFEILGHAELEWLQARPFQAFVNP